MVGTPVADTKTAPSGDVASSDPAAGLQIYKAEASPPGEGGAQPATSATLAPPPEAPSPRPVAATPVDQANLRPAQAQAPVQATPVQAAPAPVAAVAAAPPVVAAPVAAKAKPVKIAKAAKPAIAATASKTEVAEIPTGAPVAQIGAFSSSALAEKGWSDVAVLMPGKMAGKTRKVEMASSGGKTFYRAFVGGFASKAAAQSFCASLKAASHGCMVK